MEDNTSDVFIIREILRREGLHAKLEVAIDGEQALKILDVANDEGNCPDLVLLDLNLPRVSGLEILAKMRDSKRCNGIPVIVVTSSRSPGDLAAMEKLNPAGYFQKQTDLGAFLELGALIRDVLQRKG